MVHTRKMAPNTSTITKVPDRIPRTVKNKIQEYTPNLPVSAYRNCGEFYAMLPPFPIRDRLQHLRNPRRMQTMKTLVVFTILWFSRRLSATKWIREFALSPTPKETLYKRVIQALEKVRAINVAKASTTTKSADAAARTLMRTCRQILEWKKECAGILERIEFMYNDAKERLSPSLRRTQPALPDFPEKLWRGNRLPRDAGASNTRKSWDRMLEGYTARPEEGLARLETEVQREREMVQRMLVSIDTRTEGQTYTRRRRRRT